MMTLLPRACSASARACPMPEPPPVTKIVLPSRFMTVSFFSCDSGRKRGSEHREPAPPLRLRRFVLDDVPMLRQLPLRDAHDVDDDPRSGKAMAREPSVQENVVVLGHDEPVLVTQRGRQ